MIVGHLEDGGELQMLKVVGVNGAHLEAAQVNGATYPVEWVTIANPLPGQRRAVHRYARATTRRSEFVGNQGRAAGAAGFSRLRARSTPATRSTSRRPRAVAPPRPGRKPSPATATAQARCGRTVLARTLTCHYQSPGHRHARTARQHHRPQQPRHDRVVRGRPGRQLHSWPHPQRGDVRHRGEPSQAQRRVRSRLAYGEEFAGATFSPDGDTLFVNIQASQGITFAIWGPWGRVL